MWLPSSIKQKEKNKGAGETGLVLFLALTLLHFSQRSVRIWNVSLLNQKANESNQAPETANPKSQYVRQSQREANPPLHMMRVIRHRHDYGAVFLCDHRCSPSHQALGPEPPPPTPALPSGGSAGGVGGWGVGFLD